MLDDLTDVEEGVLEEVLQELRSAEMKHGQFNSMHEAYGVLVEEVEEFFDEVRANDYHGSMRHELIQTAGVAMRAVLEFDRLARR